MANSEQLMAQIERLDREFNFYHTATIAGMGMCREILDVLEDRSVPPSIREQRIYAIAKEYVRSTSQGILDVLEG